MAEAVATNGDGLQLKCPVCGQLVDMRDLRQVIWHDRPKHKPLEMDAWKPASVRC